MQNLDQAPFRFRCRQRPFVGRPTRVVGREAVRSSFVSSGRGTRGRGGWRFGGTRGAIASRNPSGLAGVGRTPWAYFGVCVSVVILVDRIRLVSHLVATSLSS